MTQSIKTKLPKYFLQGHKHKAKEMMSLIISEKITPGQFHPMYRELTGDGSVADTHISKEVEDQMRIILSVYDLAVLLIIPVD